MEALSAAAAAAWCGARGIRVEKDGELSYGQPATRQLEIVLPSTTHGLAYAARALVRIETRGLYASAGQYDKEFAGCLLWVIRHGVWSPVTEQVGRHVFECLGTAGIVAPMATHSARRFDAHETIAAEAAILQPLLFQWDAYVIPSSGNYLARIAHDGMIRSITARHPDLLQSVRAVFGDLDVREAIPGPEVVRRRP